MNARVWHEICHEHCNRCAKVMARSLQFGANRVPRGHWDKGKAARFPYVREICGFFSLFFAFFPFSLFYSFFFPFFPLSAAAHYVRR